MAGVRSLMAASDKAIDAENGAGSPKLGTMAWASVEDASGRMVDADGEPVESLKIGTGNPVEVSTFIESRKLAGRVMVFCT